MFKKWLSKTEKTEKVIVIEEKNPLAGLSDFAVKVGYLIINDFNNFKVSEVVLSTYIHLPTRIGLSRTAYEQVRVFINCNDISGRSGIYVEMTSFEQQVLCKCLDKYLDKITLAKKNEIYNKGLNAVNSYLGELK